MRQFLAWAVFLTVALGQLLSLMLSRIVYFAFLVVAYVVIPVGLAVYFRVPVLGAVFAALSVISPPPLDYTPPAKQVLAAASVIAIYSILTSGPILSTSLVYLGLLTILSFPFRLLAHVLTLPWREFKRQSMVFGQLTTVRTSAQETSTRGAENDRSIFTATVNELTPPLRTKAGRIILEEAIEYFTQIRYVVSDTANVAKNVLEVTLRCQLLLDKSWMNGDAYVLFATALNIASSNYRDKEASEYLRTSAAIIIALWHEYTVNRGLWTKNRAIGEQVFRETVPEYLLTRQLPQFEMPLHPSQRGNEGLKVLSIAGFEEVRDAVRRVYGITI